MCCKGSEIKYKDYTPADQQNARKQYNNQMMQGMRQGATPYGGAYQNAPLFAQMNPLQAMAMQSMYQQGGGQGQMQFPGYGTYAMMNGGVPQGPMNMQQQAGGGFGSQFGGGMQGPSGGASNVPFWLMMPGMGQQGPGGRGGQGNMG